MGMALVLLQWNPPQTATSCGLLNSETNRFLSPNGFIAKKYGKMRFSYC
jgi:hypothetical protein